MESQLKEIRRTFKNKRRLLAAEKLDENENELTQFNKEFKTALIRPIIYNFKEDMSVKH